MHFGFRWNLYTATQPARQMQAQKRILNSVPSLWNPGGNSFFSVFCCYVIHCWVRLRTSESIMFMQLNYVSNTLHYVVCTDEMMLELDPVCKNMISYKHIVPKTVYRSYFVLFLLGFFLQ